jgi:hypothetical protein
VRNNTLVLNMIVTSSYTVYIERYKGMGERDARTL